jgi:sugar phosphate isomerase/epimerase
VWLEQLERAQALARGVVLSLENRGIFEARHKLYALSSPYELVRFGGQRGLSLTLDTAHVASAGLDIMQTYSDLKSHVASMHVSDMRRRHGWLARPVLQSFIMHHQLPGEGWLPLNELRRALINDRFSGPVTLELSPTALGLWSPRAARRRLRQAVEWLHGAAP